jgi:glyoxylase-like metal-dependent hydrolase (beta-lactamase superfamily II)
MTSPRSPALSLPEGVVVLERGWLSSNNVVVVGARGAAVVDTGYATHAQQTVELVRSSLQGRPLLTIANTHLHSDHCGGNAALQSAFPAAVTRIPPGLAAAVKAWDTVALTFEPTGQTCPRFRWHELLRPGSDVTLGDLVWQVHAAPGHDPHSVILFEARSRCLISADALWENGFGVVFPELEGMDAFEAVRGTLDLIDDLAPNVVIPGHGAVFTDVRSALANARSRLDAYEESPERHATHAAKVLLKFKLLELQQVPLEEFVAWARSTAYFALVHGRWFQSTPLDAWIRMLADSLNASGVARIEGAVIHNA